MRIFMRINWNKSMGKIGTQKDLEDMIKEKGGLLIRQKGSHKIFRLPSGKKITVPAHGKNMKKGTFNAILKDIERE